MTTTAGAYRAVKARLTTGVTGISIPLRFDGEEYGPLSDTPSAFAYIVFDNEGSGGGPAAIGGGRGHNLYRSGVSLMALVFWPQGQGLEVGLDIAETIAARMRSFRSADISCFSADVRPSIEDGSRMAPPGLSRSNAVNNYQCAIVDVFLTFDQVG